MDEFEVEILVLILARENCFIDLEINPWNMLI